MHWQSNYPHIQGYFVYVIMLVIKLKLTKILKYSFLICLDTIRIKFAHSKERIGLNSLVYLHHNTLCNTYLAYFLGNRIEPDNRFGASQTAGLSMKLSDLYPLENPACKHSTDLVSRANNRAADGGTNVNN